MRELRGVVQRLKKTVPRTEPCGTPQVRGDEGEMFVGIPAVDVRDESYEVKHYIETEEMTNKVERRWSTLEWSRVSKAADRSGNKGRRLVAYR